MNKKELVNEIIYFGLKYGVFSKIVNLDDKSRIENQLEDCKFVEWLIGVIMIKTRGFMDKNYYPNKNLYLKLNDLRFDLEFKDIK